MNYLQEAINFVLIDKYGFKSNFTQDLILSLQEDGLEEEIQNEN